MRQNVLKLDRIFRTLRTEIYRFYWPHSASLFPFVDVHAVLYGELKL